MIFKIVDWPQIVEAVWRICSPPRATTICKTQWHLESNFFHWPRVWVATPAYQYSGNEFELFSTGSINLWYWTESSECATELRWQQLPLIPQPAGRPSIFYASWRLDIDKLLYSADSSEHTSDWRQYQFRGKGRLTPVVWRTRLILFTPAILLESTNQEPGKGAIEMKALYFLQSVTADTCIKQDNKDCPKLFTRTNTICTAKSLFDEVC